MHGRLLLTLGAISAALVLPACGAEDAAKKLDPVAEAAGNTIDAGGADLGGKMTMELEGQQIDLEIDGVVDFGRSRMRMTMDTVGEVQKELKAVFPISMAVDGSTMYQQMPMIEKILPSGKTWMKIDIERVTGMDMSSLGGGSGSDPAAMIESLKHAGETKKIGTEDIGGEEMTHYRTMLDPKKVAAKAEKMSPRVKKALEQMGDQKMPIDVWIDREGRLRREDMDLDQQGTKVKMTMTFDNFRNNVDVPIPSDADAEDMTDEIEKEMQKGGG
jgi:outer membrane lipoprotein-sorting protein